MSRPTIRILHVLARSGGTLVSKCLASMEEVMLLSEIHPLASGRMSPVRQACDWFGLLTPEEAGQLDGPGRFAAAIALLRERAQARDKKLILREWSHLDFYGLPFVDVPSGRSGLVESLAADFSLHRAALTRHPLDQLLSLGRLAIMKGKLNLDHFLKGYRRFAEMAVKVGFVRYEDVTAAPDATLRRLCSLLDIAFDPAYAGRWASWDKITGDSGRSRGEIETAIRPLPHLPVSPSLLARMDDHAEYQRVLMLLGYQHPQAA